MFTAMETISTQWQQSRIFCDQVLVNSGFILLRWQDELREGKENSEDQGIAYVMQTSGTTGEAKAIRVPHMCIVPNITDLRYVYYNV